MKTLVTGSSGLVGSALVESLFNSGHSIQCLKRNTESESAPFWRTQSPGLDNDCRYKAVIHLAGENVAGGRWTASRKKRILNSRVDGTKQLIDYISQLTAKPEIFLCASAVGYYGSRGAEMLDEGSSLGPGFLAEVCDKWEKETRRLSEMGVRVVNLRFGMVLSPKGGALHKMIPPFKAFLGGVVGSGDQYISWISIRDLVEAVAFIIENEHICGPVNIVSPAPTTNRLLTQSLGRVLNRPTLFRVPSLMAKILFGEMADEMLLSSTRVTPKILLESGYAFKDRSLDDVLRFCTSTG